MTEAVNDAVRAAGDRARSRTARIAPVLLMAVPPLFAVPAALAQAVPTSRPALRAGRLDGEFRLDGRPHEAAWTVAIVGSRSSKVVCGRARLVAENLRAPRAGRVLRRTTGVYPRIRNALID